MRDNTLTLVKGEIYKIIAEFRRELSKANDESRTHYQGIFEKHTKMVLAILDQVVQESDLELLLLNLQDLVNRSLFLSQNNPNNLIIKLQKVIFVQTLGISDYDFHDNKKSTRLIRYFCEQQKIFYPELFLNSNYKTVEFFNTFGTEKPFELYLINLAEKITLENIESKTKSDIIFCLKKMFSGETLNSKDNESLEKKFEKAAVYLLAIYSAQPVIKLSLDYLRNGNLDNFFKVLFSVIKKIGKASSEEKPLFNEDLFPIIVCSIGLFFKSKLNEYALFCAVIKHVAAVIKAEQYNKSLKDYSIFSALGEDSFLFSNFTQALRYLDENLIYQKNTIVLDEFYKFECEKAMVYLAIRRMFCQNKTGDFLNKICELVSGLDRHDAKNSKLYTEEILCYFRLIMRLKSKEINHYANKINSICSMLENISPNLQSKIREISKALSINAEIDLATLVSFDLLQKKHELNSMQKLDELLTRLEAVFNFRLDTVSNVTSMQTLNSYFFTNTEVLLQPLKTYLQTVRLYIMDEVPIQHMSRVSCEEIIALIDRLLQPIKRQILSNPLQKPLETGLEKARKLLNQIQTPANLSIDVTQSVLTDSP